MTSPLLYSSMTLWMTYRRARNRRMASETMPRAPGYNVADTSKPGITKREEKGGGNAVFCVTPR